MIHRNILNRNVTQRRFHRTIYLYFNIAYSFVNNNIYKYAIDTIGHIFDVYKQNNDRLALDCDLKVFATEYLCDLFSYKDPSQTIIDLAVDALM